MNKKSLRKLENDLGVAVETKKYTYGGNVYFIGFDNSEEYYKNINTFMILPKLSQNALRKKLLRVELFARG